MAASHEGAGRQQSIPKTLRDTCSGTAQNSAPASETNVYSETVCLANNATSSALPVGVPCAGLYQDFESLSLRQSTHSGHSFSCARRRLQ